MYGCGVTLVAVGMGRNRNRGVPLDGELYGYQSFQLEALEFVERNVGPQSIVMVSKREDRLRADENIKLFCCAYLNYDNKTPAVTSWTALQLVRSDE